MEAFVIGQLIRTAHTDKGWRLDQFHTADRERGKQTMRKKSAALSAVMAVALFLSGCGNGGDPQNAAQSLRERLLSGAAPLAEEAHGSPRTLTLESVHYGSFSSSAAEELCALFKYDAPVHMEGLDRTLGVVYAADGWEVVAGCDLMADDVQISFLPADDGTERIFYLGASTNQGLTSYTLGLYKISSAAWEPMETGLPAMDERSAVYLAEEKILCVTPEGVCTAYEWNSKTQGFEQTDAAEGQNTSWETGAYSFPAGARDASEFFTVQELDLPPAINGMDYSFHGFIDDGVLMIQLYDTLRNAPVQREFGALNIVTGEYETLFSVPEGETYSLRCADSRYAVCSRRDERTGEYVLRLFDLAAGEGRDIYTYAPVYTGINVPVDQMLLLDRRLYFSDVMPGETHATGRTQLLCYDMETGDLSAVAEGARDPVALNGQLAWVSGPDAEGDFALARACGETTPLRERPVYLTAAGEGAYARGSRETGGPDNAHSLIDLATGEELLTSSIAIDRLQGSGAALAWNNSKEETPVLYLPGPGCCAVFSGLDKAYNSFRLGEEEIFLLCTHDQGPRKCYRILPK